MKNVDPTHFKHSLHLPFHRLTPLHPSPLYTHTFPLSESIPIHATASHVLNGTLISILVRLESHLFPPFSILFFPFFVFLFFFTSSWFHYNYVPALPFYSYLFNNITLSRHTPLVSFRISIHLSSFCHSHSILLPTSLPPLQFLPFPSTSPSIPPLPPPPLSFPPIIV